MPLSAFKYNRSAYSSDMVLHSSGKFSKWRVCARRNVDSIHNDKRLNFDRCVRGNDDLF